MIAHPYIDAAVLCLGVTGTILYFIYKASASRTDDEELTLGIGAYVESNVTTMNLESIPMANTVYAANPCPFCDPRCESWVDPGSDLEDLFDDDDAPEITSEQLANATHQVGRVEVTPEAFKWACWVHGRMLAEKNYPIYRTVYPKEIHFYD